MNENKLELIADNLTDVVMTRIYGQEYLNCEDITENKEMSDEWLFYHEVFTKILAEEINVI